MAKIIKHKKFNMLSNVKEYYKHCYPSDLFGNDMNENINFAQLLAKLCDKRDFYAVIGVNDSIVRERLFAALALFGGLKYREVYDLWLNS